MNTKNFIKNYIQCEQVRLSVLIKERLQIVTFLSCFRVGTTFSFTERQFFPLVKRFRICVIK